MFGIEPSGCRRLRNSKGMDVTINTKNLVLEVLLNQLESIAKERNIPLITIEGGSLYNFYPGIGAEIYPTKIVERIYNNSDSNIKFQRFVNRQGELLEKVKTIANDSLSLYSCIK